MAHTLGGDMTWGGVAGFLLLWIPVWWVWIGHVYYTERFETNDVSYRFLTFLLMVGVAAMGFHVHDGIGETSSEFALSYAFSRFVIVLFWWRAWRHHPATRILSSRFIIGFSISLVLWLISTQVAEPVRFYIWAVALFIDLITPFFTLNFQNTLPSISGSHLPERFAIFTILVLREPIAGVIDGIGEATHHLDIGFAIDGFLGLLLAFLLWWMYFDQVSDHRIRGGIGHMIIWSYLHLPLTMGIAAIGAGLLNAFHYPSDPLDGPIRFLICGGTAVTLFVIALIELTEEVPRGEVKRLGMLEIAQIAAGVGVIVLGLLATTLGPTVFFILLLAIVVVPIGLQLLLMDPADTEHDLEANEVRIEA